jgi:hypothetical protein
VERSHEFGHCALDVRNKLIADLGKAPFADLRFSNSGDGMRRH